MQCSFIPRVPRLSAVLRPSVGAGLLAAGLLGLAGSAPAQFASAMTMAAASQPHSVAVGDWDGDLDLDLAIAVSGPDRVIFLLNDGQQVFGTPTVVLTGSGTSPHSAVAADLDNDGDTDVAVSLQGSNAVRVLLNNGTGTFALGSLSATGAEPRSLRVGNFNGGAPDLVTCNRAGNSITVLLNNGLGSFAASTLATGADPRDVTVGDLNGDGDLDLAVAVHDDGTIELFANGGAGAFSAVGPLSLGSQLEPSGLTLTDADGDTDLDLAVAASGNGLHVVAFFTNVGPGTGGGAFVAPVSFAVGGQDPTRIVDGDFNHDGSADLATVNEISADVSVLLGDAQGSYGAPALFAVGSGPQSLVAADVDDNGSPDLLTANELGNSISLLLNLNGDTVFIALPSPGLAGVAGIPTLTGESTLQAGTAVSLLLTGAAPNAASAMVLGVSQLNTPFKGGILVPDDDAFIVLPTSNTGTIAIAGTFPSGVPSGTNLFIQFIVADVAAVNGFAISNAIQGITP